MGEADQYLYCVVIHFAAHPPSKRWPEGISACNHAEWVGSCALAERKASPWVWIATMGTQIILGCPGGPWPWRESYVAPRRRRFGLSVNLSRNP